jgi:xanthine dehydrogenase accessory factor
MQNLDVIVLKRLKEWRDAGQRAVLVTVMRTWGSSPRPIGSIMAMCETGAVVGSVSGGCIEDDLIREFTQPAQDQQAPGMDMSGAPKRMRYGITADEAHRFGLPCGGTLELLLEFNPDAALLTELIDKLEQGELMRRITNMDNGTVRLEPTETADSLRIHGDF